MGKEGDLWDDSALVEAFDSAMSKYKRMHGKKTSEANASVAVDQCGDEAMKHRDAGESSNATSNTRSETAKAKDHQPVEENDDVCTQTPEPYIDSSNNLPMQDKQDGHRGYSDMQGTEDYNQLLSQYYEVEEKRQNLLQQMQQYGSYNYQYPAEGYGAAAQWGSACTSQEYPIPTSQASYSTVVCSCCPYGCQSLVTPCTSYPCCSLGGRCFDKTSNNSNSAVPHVTGIDCDFVETAMGAAERAISSMMTKASVDPNLNEDNKEKKDSKGETNHNTSCETDLTVLLNAWYSAGFYTGKYLVEQSIAKKR